MKNLFFYILDYYKVFCNHMPPGRIYKKCNDNIFFSMLSKIFEKLKDNYNLRFKGIYPKLSNYYLKEYKKQFSLPSLIFENDEGDFLDNIRDVFVLKYLARNNTALGLQKIANAYGVRARFVMKRDYLKEKKSDEAPVDNTYNIILDNTIIVKFYSQIGDRYYKTVNDQGIKYPFVYGKNLRYQKLRLLYDKIKPMHLKFEYVIAGSDEIVKYKKDPNEPDFITYTINNKEVEKIFE